MSSAHLRSEPDLPVVAERSYRYVRLSLVALVLALAVAVVQQSLAQHRLLASLSAYYYTPAQAVFVGALFGLGAALVALRGATDVEDVLLDLGGMLAPVVAVVPTSRSQDFRAALAVCRDAGAAVLTDRLAGDCPTVRALAAATRANVVNGMVALLVTAGVVLAFTVVVAAAERRTATLVRRLRPAAALYLVVLGSFAVATDGFVARAHYAAAAGLFACVVLVVVANAVRRNRDAERGTGLADLARHEGRWYLLLAVVLVGAAAVLGALVLAGALALFWLESVLVLLFGVFWVAQTAEHWQPGRAGTAPEPQPAARVSRRTARGR